MRNTIGAACVLTVAFYANAMAQPPAANVVRKAAEALGGVDRIQSIRSLRIEEYGQEAVPQRPTARRRIRQPQVTIWGGWNETNGVTP